MISKVLKWQHALYGFNKVVKKGGEFHHNTPDLSKLLHKAIRGDKDSKAVNGDRKIGNVKKPIETYFRNNFRNFRRFSQNFVKFDIFR